MIISIEITTQYILDIQKQYVPEHYPYIILHVYTSSDMTHTVEKLNIILKGILRNKLAKCNQHTNTHINNIIAMHRNADEIIEILRFLENDIPIDITYTDIPDVISEEGLITETTY
jgi:hypothetical protein